MAHRAPPWFEALIGATIGGLPVALFWLDRWEREKREAAGRA